MLRQRLPIGIALILIFVAILWVDGKTAPYHPIWIGLVTLLSVLASLELQHLLAKSIARPYAYLMTACSAACLFSNSFSAASNINGPLAFGPVAIIFCFSLAAILVKGVHDFDDMQPIMPRLASTVFGVAYVGILGSFLAQIRFLNGPEQGAFALALLIGVTKGTDTGAYTFGKIFGRHLMTPKLSPKKTWEGAMGGLIFAVLMAQIITSLEISVRGQAALEWLPARLLFAITVSIAGQLGDLAESLIKREAHLKDASTVIPGFGGVLDLLDSLFLAAPVGWAILTILR